MSNGLFLILLVPSAIVAAADDEASLFDAVVVAHNRERAERKLPPLVRDARLDGAARSHVADMVKRGLLEHARGDIFGSGEPSPFLETGENIAKDQTTAEGVMKVWMSSIQQRDNVLGEFTSIGVARAKAEDGSVFWCVAYGRRFAKLDAAKAEAEVFERLNHARADAGIDSFRHNAQLARVARELASDAGKPDREKRTAESEAIAQGDRIRSAGYDFASAAVCEADGMPTPEALLRHLLGNDTQRGALLGTRDSDIGIGYAFSARGRPYWCVILARPKPQKP